MSGFLTQEDFEKIFTSHLKIGTYSRSIESLFSLRSLNKIDYKPYYQRNYVWDDHKATYFIESILLGTEIPPLIFFDNGSGTEVIDGRQRFETIKRFKENEFSLTRNGLEALKQIAKATYESLQASSETKSIINLFLTAKIRIIEFKIVSEPRLDLALEDKVKKEIFGRYNSGITPLKKPEIDNALYDADSVFRKFKNLVKQDSEFCNMITDLFLPKESERVSDRGRILQFIRRYLVLYKFPIRYYSWGNNRTETLDKLYEHMTNEVDNIDDLCNKFVQKIRLVHRMKQIFTEKNLILKRPAFECLLWAIQVLDAEQIDLSEVNNNDLIERLGQAISNNNHKFIDSHYYSNVQERFSFTAKLFEQEFSVNFRVYLEGNKKTRDELNLIRKSKNDDTVTILGELASLRVTKPEPSLNSIDDIATVMDRDMFLVRPSYQRSEVINISKASSIIESILLGISLPPIFIYKRKDDVSEVIDGQQRLLTILGFIGKSYMDENGNQCTSKNSGFPLKGLKILKHLNNKTYNDLKDFDASLQDKILDFGLLVVEIQENLNPEFNPVDLFVRLNNKPYPIRENSFEMWNSWVDRDIIESIRKNLDKHREWFYIKLVKSSNDRDRMENEELYTSLAYLEYQHLKRKDADKSWSIYNRNDGINLRVPSHEITRLLQNAFEDEEVKTNFLKGIKNVESFVKKVKLILLDRDVEGGKEALDKFFGDELNLLFKAQRQVRSCRRTKQDFYILWYLVNPLNLEMVKFNRLKIKQDLQNIFYDLRKNSENFTKDLFRSKAQNFYGKYAIKPRQTKLSEAEKLEKLKEQDNRCAISGSPLFIGDDIEVDHNIPLSIGGVDSIENLQITHRDSNRKKGSKPPSQ
ncbi:GmrSD restriction endonuclease domain-containing protein [Microcoleus sp. N9_A1]|uniref:GmrSD restriction endonuclease domain-containing protein n=1 Tax=Microcoleus sp. N9_A1 TaxID=3055380 RepID=UPI002FCE9EE3